MPESNRIESNQIESNQIKSDRFAFSVLGWDSGSLGILLDKLGVAKSEHTGEHLFIHGREMCHGGGSGGCDMTPPGLILDA